MRHRENHPSTELCRTQRCLQCKTIFRHVDNDEEICKMFTKSNSCTRSKLIMFRRFENRLWQLHELIHVYSFLWASFFLSANQGWWLALPHEVAVMLKGEDVYMRWSFVTVLASVIAKTTTVSFNSLQFLLRYLGASRWDSKCFTC